MPRNAVSRNRPAVPARFLTRADIERAVADLFTNGSGRRATRLVLTDDARPGSDLGGWSERGVVDRLCEALGVPKE